MGNTNSISAVISILATPCTSSFGMRDYQPPYLAEPALYGGCNLNLDLTTESKKNL